MTSESQNTYCQQVKSVSPLEGISENVEENGASEELWESAGLENPPENEELPGSRELESDPESENEGHGDEVLANTEEGCRISLEKDSDHVRKLVDPRLPKPSSLRP